jgi:hypothetical protein
MPKYVKRPIVIDAVQFTMQTFCPEITDFIGESANYPECKTGGIDPSDGKFKIKTLEGDMVADLDDFIIKGINGEFYPCKPEIFHATYQLKGE